MAKTSKVNKNELRKALVAKYSKRRAEYKEIIRSPKSTPDQREEARLKLDRLPRDSSATRVVNRCAITGRPHGNLRFFNLCRITFREMAHRGELAGVVKASW